MRLVSEQENDFERDVPSREKASSFEIGLIADRLGSAGAGAGAE